jgi:transposase
MRPSSVGSGRTPTPALVAIKGVGTDIASTLLTIAGDNPERLTSEGAAAHLVGVAPIEASSGKITRYRLNRGGDRQGNRALYLLAVGRMGWDPATRTYVAPYSSGSYQTGDHPLPQALYRP